MQGREKTNKIKKANEPFVSLLICFSTEIYQGGTVLAFASSCTKIFVEGYWEEWWNKKRFFCTIQCFWELWVNFSITSTATY